MSTRPNTLCPRVLAVLRAAGTTGALSSEVAKAAGRSVDNTALHLLLGVEQGLVCWRPDPVGRANRMRRWWLTEHYPKAPKLVSVHVQTHGTGWRKPPPTPPKAQAGVQRCPGWTHDRRYQIGPGERPPPLFSALPVGKYLEE